MSEHIVSKKTYAWVFGALLVLLVISVVTAELPLSSSWSLALAMSISVAKTLLIATFFMHLLHSPSLTKILALGSLLWLTFLMVLTFSDYETRSWQSDAGQQYQRPVVDRAEENHQP